MNGFWLVIFLIGAVGAVLLIGFLIRYFGRSTSRRGPMITRPEPDAPELSRNVESSWNIPEQNAFHRPQSNAERGVRINQTPQGVASEQAPIGLDIDKNVQFTIYRPATIVPNRWYPLLAFAHLTKRRPDAPKDQLDPVEEVLQQAAKILSDQPALYEPTKLDRGFSVPRRGHLTFVPLIRGCEFNPPTQSVLWQKTVHKVEFEMQASESVDGQDVEGQMTVYLGNIVLTEIPLRISVDSQYIAATSQPAFEEVNAEPYRKIFASYSHKDTEIVEDFETYVQALGDQYLRDVKNLRAGEVWSEALKRMIREATVFQLFWSSNSMRSKFVKQEWEYALKLNKPGFIRPVYWEEPLPEVNQDLPPAALRRLHFYKFPEITESSSAGSDLTTTPVIPAAGGSSPASSPRSGSKSHVLALIFFVVMGSGVFLFYQTMSKPPPGVYALPPPLEVQVDRMIQLRAPGDSGEYSLLVSNTTPSAVKDAAITEHLPHDLEYITSEPQPTRQEGPQIIIWQAAEISEQKPFAIRVKVRLRRDLQPGQGITTTQTITYKDEQGEENTVHFSVVPVIRPKPG